MSHTIGEVAKQLNISPSTLRYYDKEGLLPFLERSSGGIRMFKDEDLTNLKTIECLKKTGMSIKDIKYFIDCCMIGDSKINERLSIMETQRISVIQQMQEMQDMLDMLNYKCWYYETAKDAGTCSIHDPDHVVLEKIPQEFHKFITDPTKN